MSALKGHTRSLSLGSDVIGTPNEVSTVLLTSAENGAGELLSAFTAHTFQACAISH